MPRFITFFRRYRAVLVVLAVGVAGSLALRGLVNGWERGRLEQTLQTTALLHRSTINSRIDGVLADLQGLRGIFGAPLAIDDDQFHAATDVLTENNFFVDGVAWAPRIAAGERAALEAAERAAGHADFSIRQLTGEGRTTPADAREAYFPLLRLNFQQQSPVPRGLDFAAISPDRRAALEYARDSGGIALTPPVSLVGSEQLGAIVVVPVYRAGQLRDSIEERRRHFRGALLLGLRVGPLLTPPESTS